jgi:hypothetical protein
MIRKILSSHPGGGEGRVAAGGAVGLAHGRQLQDSVVQLFLQQWGLMKISS